MICSGMQYGLCQGSNPGYDLTECDYDDECACECHHA